MKFTCTIEVDNDSFIESPQHLGHLLSSLGEHLAYEGIQPGDGNTIRDYNGNTVGEWEIQP